MSRDIQKIIHDVNESLTDSQELTGTQRNALMLVHLITNVDDIVSKVTKLEDDVKNQNDKFTTIERRLKVLEDNSIAAMLIFVKENWKLVVTLLVTIFSALGAAPELVKILASLVGIELK